MTDFTLHRMFPRPPNGQPATTSAADSTWMTRLRGSTQDDQTACAAARAVRRWDGLTVVPVRQGLPIVASCSIAPLSDPFPCGCVWLVGLGSGELQLSRGTQEK